METKTAAAGVKTEPGVAGVAERMGLIQWAAQRFGEVEAGKVMGILRATCFKVSANDEPATDAEVAALLIVARNYDLNPFTKEIFAFKDKHKGIVPIVSIDGWVSLVTRHKDFNGVEFSTGDTIKAEHGGKDAFKSVTCKMYRKGIERAVEVTEYLDEVYQPPRGQNNTFGPWQTHPKRMHRHKAYIQCARLTFGFGGIFDEDEGERIIGAGVPELVIGGATGKPSESTALSTETVKRVEGEHQPATRTSSLAKDLRQQAAAAEDAVVTEVLGAGGVTPTPTPAPQPEGQPTFESVRKDIESAGSFDDLNKILLDKVMKMEASEERNRLMLEWTARGQVLKGVPPAQSVPPAFDGKGGEKGASKAPAKKSGGKPGGTPELLDTLIDRMDKAATSEDLNLASDESRGYQWSAGQMQILNDKYAERVSALAPR